MSIDTLRSSAHLQRELGDDRFQVLVSSDNTEAVRKFVDDLILSQLPKELTVGGRTYEILSFLRGNEKKVIGHTMVERAKEMNAHLGREERLHLIAHQDEIHTILRGKIVFVFTDDRHPDYPGFVCYVYWDGARWVVHWDWLVNDWRDSARVLRRK